ncbi:methyl-accepting chemotaxis protein [Celerinatantimonas sp. YJH-8]|uniref:methyl-accepting chemotaxis protein n=1 Tax=Celerinatantimonas sp. YJH-8 TaxID=3228714 RepID=UPI0038C914FA
MSLKQKLTLTVIIVLAILSTAQIAVETQTQRQNAVQALNQSSQRIGRTTALQLSNWLENKIRILNTVSTLEQDNHFAKALYQGQRSGGFSLVYFGRNDGAMITGDPNYHKPDGYDPRARPWYQQALTQNLYISTPYHDAASGDLVLTLSKRIKNGVIATDLSISSMVEQIQSLSNTDLQAFLVDNQGQILVYPDASYVGKQLGQLSPQLSLQNLTDGQLTDATMSGNAAMVRFISIKNSPWYLGLNYSQKAVLADVDKSYWHSIFYGVFSFIIIALILYGSIYRAFLPLARLNRRILTLGEGTADLTQRLTDKRTDEIGQLSQGFDRVLERLHHMLLAIRENTQQLVQTADSSAQMAEQSHRSLNQQQQDVTQVATALHEMSVTANEVAAHAEQTAQAAQRSSENSLQGRELMQNNQQQITKLADLLEHTAQGVKQLDDDSQAMTNILATIQDIAEQTNLLALNAAIEAARAGDQGRGFAVVADEVRTLSQRTQQSTEAIQQMLNQLEQNTEQTVTTMQESRKQAQQSIEQARQATQALDQMTQSITEISDMSTQIASAAEEQRAVTDEISRNTQGISDVSDALQQQSNQGSSQAQQLHQIAAQLQQQIGQFIL